MALEVLARLHRRTGEAGGEIHRGPSYVWIEPTTRCNTRCAHCPHYYQDFGEDMDAALYRRIRDSALGAPKTVELVGLGEPLLSPLFDEMLDDCRRRGAEVLITTNGLLLRSDERLARIVRRKVMLCLSVDGARRETYEFVRPHIAWDRMVETLERIQSHARAAGAQRQFRLRFNFVAMKKTLEELPDLVELARRYGASSICVLPLVGANVFPRMNGQGLDDCPDLLASVFQRGLALSARYGIDLSVPMRARSLLFGANGGNGPWAAVRGALRAARFAPSFVRSKGFRRVARAALQRLGPKAKAGTARCPFPRTGAFFASDGGVYACCMKGLKLGDMKAQEWGEIWNGQRYRSLRRTVHSWNPTSICRHCFLQTGIAGGDEGYYDRLFSKFRCEPIPIDAPGLGAEGFFEVERQADGTPSHRWMGKQGTLRLPMKPGARFLRLQIVVRSQEPDMFNWGWCSINNGPPEPFDNTCGEIHFPLSSVRSPRIEARIEVENVFRVPPDPRELGLAIRGIQLLF